MWYELWYKMSLESMVVVVFPKRRPHFPIIIGKMIKEKKNHVYKYNPMWNHKNDY